MIAQGARPVVSGTLSTQPKERRQEFVIELVMPERVLETPRLLLEPLTAAHARAFYEPLMDERIYRFIPGGAPASLQALADRYKLLASRRSPDGSQAWLNWAVRLRANHEYVGRVEATVHNGKADIAYVFFPSSWGQGYARESCRRMVEHLFEDWRVVLVAAEIDERNLASVRLAEAIGLVLAGRHDGELRYERRSTRPSDSA